MADYRIYLLGDDGHIVSGSDACCANDEDALALAKGMLKNGGRAEVWQGTRCVDQIAESSTLQAQPGIPAHTVRTLNFAATSWPEPLQSRTPE